MLALDENWVGRVMRVGRIAGKAESAAFVRWRFDVLNDAFKIETRDFWGDKGLDLGERDGKSAGFHT